MVLTGRAGLTGCRAAAAAAAAAAGFMAEYIPPPRWFEFDEWFSFKIDETSFRGFYKLCLFFPLGKMAGRTHTGRDRCQSKSKWRSCMKIRCFNYSILNHHAVSKKLFFFTFFQDGKFHAAIVKRKKEGGGKRRGGGILGLPFRHHSTRTHTHTGAYTGYILYTLTHTH